MGRKCYVPKCTSGYDSNPEKVSFFSVPKDDERLAEWNEIISRKDRKLSKKDSICAKHFKPDDILKEWRDASNMVQIPLQRHRLKKDVIPSIFPSSPNKKKRKYRKNGKQNNNKARRTKLTSTTLPEWEKIYIKEEIDLPDLITDSSIVESLQIVSEETEQSLEDCNLNDDTLEMLISREENNEHVVKHNNQNNNHLQPMAPSDNQKSSVLSLNAIEEPNAPLVTLNFNREETVTEMAPSDNQKSSVVSLNAIEEPNAPLVTLNFNREETVTENLKIPGAQIDKTSVPKSSFDSVNFISQSSSSLSLELSNSKDKQNEQPIEIVNSKEDRISIDKSLEIVNSKDGGQQPQKIVRLPENADIFDTIWNGTLKPPNEFWSFVRIENKEKYVSFGKYILSEKGLPIAERQVLVKKDLTTKYILNNNIVPLDILPNVIRSVDELEEILICINSFKMCMGGPNIEKYPTDIVRKYTRKKYVDTFSNVWRHSECKLIILEDTRSNRCMFCKIVQRSLNCVNKRMQLKKSSGKIDSKNSNRNKTKCINRLRIKVEKLKSHMKEIKQKMSTIEKTSIVEKLDTMDIPKPQQLLIMQCIDQSKLHNPRQMRFHKNWLQISLLIYQKNRGMYRYLQETGILPLPCRRTIHGYLNGTNIKSRED